jgi:diaminohydroxyphosphoribosylaminopyrimidine deaminase/5-amino-6-(5-phosphoribosylamino)uracil reductase
VSPARDLLGSGAQCVSCETTEAGIDLEFLLDDLGRRELNEVQVEAGSRLCGSLLARGLVDEILLYMAPVMLGDGGPGPFSFGPLDSMTDRAHFSLLETVRVGDDTRLRLKPHAGAD